jgi:hypothetical protein
MAIILIVIVVNFRAWNQPSRVPNYSYNVESILNN